MVLETTVLPLNYAPMYDGHLRTVDLYYSTGMIGVQAFSYLLAKHLFCTMLQDLFILFTSGNFTGLFSGMSTLIFRIKFIL